MALSSSFTLAGETYYRWADKWGNPVHSDRPPPKGTDYEVVETGTSLVRRVNSAEGVVPAEVEPSTDNKLEQGDTGPPEYKIEKNAEYCTRARDNLETLNTVARIRLRNNEGEYHYLSEEEKEVRRAESRDQVEAYCE